MMEDSVQSKGGKARAKSLSALRRSEIASVAATARWNGLAKEMATVLCCSGKSPDCVRSVEVVASCHDQVNRVVIKLNWNILHDHERIYGYMCPACVRAHGPKT